MDNFINYDAIKERIKQQSITYTYKPLHNTIIASKDVKKDATSVYRESMAINNTVLEKLKISNDSGLNNTLIDYALDDIVHLYDKINLKIYMLEKHNNITVYIPDDAHLVMDGIVITVDKSYITIEAYYKQD